MFNTCNAKAEYTPYDGVPSEEYVTISLPVTVTLSVLSIIGIICAVICLLFNAIFHKRRYTTIPTIFLQLLCVLYAVGFVYIQDNSSR